MYKSLILLLALITGYYAFNLKKSLKVVRLINKYLIYIIVGYILSETININITNIIHHIVFFIIVSNNVTIGVLLKLRKYLLIFLVNIVE